MEIGTARSLKGCRRVSGASAVMVHDLRLTSTARGHLAASGSSVAVGPAGDVDLVALGVGQGPPPGRVLVADYVAAGGKRRRDARLRLVVRHIDIDVDPV